MIWYSVFTVAANKNKKEIDYVYERGTEDAGKGDGGVPEQFLFTGRWGFLWWIIR